MLPVYPNEKRTGQLMTLKRVEICATSLCLFRSRLSVVFWTQKLPVHTQSPWNEALANRRYTKVPRHHSIQIPWVQPIRGSGVDTLFAIILFQQRRVSNAGQGSETLVCIAMHPRPPNAEVVLSLDGVSDRMVDEKLQPTGPSVALGEMFYMFSRWKNRLGVSNLPRCTSGCQEIALVSTLAHVTKFSKRSRNLIRETEKEQKDEIYTSCGFGMHNKFGMNLKEPPGRLGPRGASLTR